MNNSHTNDNGGIISYDNGAYDVSVQIQKGNFILLYCYMFVSHVFIGAKEIGVDLPFDYENNGYNNRYEYYN